jgi:hypothetical protein
MFHDLLNFGQAKMAQGCCYHSANLDAEWRCWRLINITPTSAAIMLDEPIMKVRESPARRPLPISALANENLKYLYKFFLKWITKVNEVNLFLRFI